MFSLALSWSVQPLNIRMVPRPDQCLHELCLARPQAHPARLADVLCRHCLQQDHLWEHKDMAHSVTT